MADADRVALEGRTILAVLAHPDDEALACGGTLARAADAGARIVLLCASRGERGSVSDPALLQGHTLAEVRTHELDESARILHIAEAIVLDYPDGNLYWSRVTEFQADIDRTIRRLAPDVIITFDRDGLYWHRDHVAVHERTTAVVLAAGAEAPPLYYVTLPPGTMRATVDAMRQKHGAPPDILPWGIPPDAFGKDAPAPTFTIDVRPWATQKLRAIRSHHTQVGSHSPFAWIEDAEAEHWLGREQFRRAPTETSKPSRLEQMAVQS